jgi:hypothetical protein
MVTDFVTTELIAAGWRTAMGNGKILARHAYEQVNGESARSALRAGRDKRDYRQDSCEDNRTYLAERRASV